MISRFSFMVVGSLASLALGACDRKEGSDEGESAECMAGTTPAGPWTVDLDGFPEVEGDSPIEGNAFFYDGACEVVSLELADALLTISLACEHGLPEPVPVTLTATADALPTGVELGAVLPFSAELSESPEFVQVGPKFRANIDVRNYHLRDDAGPIFSAARGFGRDDYEFPPLNFAIMPCAATYEYPDQARAYWEVGSGTETIGVAEGFVETIGDGTHTWRISNGTSFLTCCPGPEVGFLALRQ